MEKEYEEIVETPYDVIKETVNIIPKYVDVEEGEV